LKAKFSRPMGATGVMRKGFESEHGEKTREQLVEELDGVYQRVADLERCQRKNDGGAGTAAVHELAKPSAIEQMPDGVMLVDTNGNVVYVNKAFERLLGYGSDELIGRHALDLPTYGGPKDREKAGAALKELMEKGSAEHVDIGAISKSGKEIAISFAASVVRDALGSPRTLVAVMRDVTKRKRAEDMLRKREENFRALVDNSMDISLITNVDLTVRYVSPSVERAMGYKPDEVIGRNALDFISPDDVSNIMRDYASTSQHPGQLVSVEVHFLHKDGTWRIVEAVTNNLFDDPTVMGLVVNVRDVTERKRAEEAVRQREEHFRALIENSLEGIAILDADLTIRYESPSAERITGFRPGELVGTSVLGSLHPDDRERAVKTFRKLAKRPAQAVPATVRVLHKDGTWHIMEGTANNLLSNPAVNGIVVNYRDVTERQRAQEALKQREEHFRVMIENSLDDVAILDAEGEILYQSPSIDRVLGYKAGEHKGENALAFPHPDDRARVTEAFDAVVKNPGSTYQGEVRAEHRDGSLRTLEVIARNFLDDPVVGGILVNFRDITERKTAEERRVEHAAALARAEELQLSRQRIVAAQESVRREIAQQLHGSVQNRLIIAVHRLTELERQASSAGLANELADLRLKVREVLDTQVRPISHRLYPSILRRGLVAALQSLADQFETALDIEMALDAELALRERSEPQLIVEQVRLAAYRIAEEALTNVVKHAQGSGVELELKTVGTGWLCLKLRDDGQGFDLAGASKARGLGMMQDYAEVAGGICSIRSALGEGTEVTAILPLGGPAAAHPE